MHQILGVTEHVVKQLSPIARKLVLRLPCFPVREVGAVGAPLLLEILPAPLHEVVAKVIAQVFAPLTFRHLAQAGKLRVQQRQKVVKRFGIAAVGCGREQHQMSIGLGR